MGEGAIEGLDRQTIGEMLASESELKLELEQMSAQGLDISLEVINTLVIKAEDFENIKPIIKAHKEARIAKKYSEMGKLRVRLTDILDEYLD